MLYHGALDQREREQAVARFNNGSRPVLVATDLAARGLDIKTSETSSITTSRSLPKPGHTVTAAPPALMPTATYSCLSDLTRILRTMLLLTIPDILIRRKSPGWPLSGNHLFLCRTTRETVKRRYPRFPGERGRIEPQQIGVIDVFDHYALAAVDRQQAPMMERVKGRKSKEEADDFSSGLNSENYFIKSINIYML